MPGRGRPPKDDRVMLSAMLFVLRTGVPWRDLPACYGPWSSVYTRYRRWCDGGLFARMLTVLTSGAEGELRHLDCSHIKLHQHGANPRGGQAAQAMGRTKGGLNTKLSAVVDARGRVLAVSLAPSQQHDQHAVIPGLACVRHRRVVATRALTPTSSAPVCAPSGPVAASHRNAADGTRLASIVVTTSAVT